MNSGKKPSGSGMWLLGAGLILPMLLVCGPLAGFLAGQFFLVNYLGWPDYWVPLTVALGFGGSALQSYKLIKRIKDSEEK